MDTIRENLERREEQARSDWPAWVAKSIGLKVQRPWDDDANPREQQPAYRGEGLQPAGFSVSTRRRRSSFDLGSLANAEAVP